MAAFVSQAEIDAAFADMDVCLGGDEVPAAGGGCRNCGSRDLLVQSNAGATHSFGVVCRGCGVEQGFLSDTPRTHRTSNYKRIHHWHERISQLLLCESTIPDAEFEQIAERLLDGSHTVLSKDVVRTVLRSLNMQTYIEKWLQIVQRVTGVEPPKPGGFLLLTLDDKFQALQQPFANTHDAKRKNFLNYNYVFCRLFQELNCDKFCMFFPLIKSRQKLRALDDMWKRMVTWQGRPYQPLRAVPPFAVRLEQPSHLLATIRARFAGSTVAVPRALSEQTESQRSDRCRSVEADALRQCKRARLDLLGQPLRRRPFPAQLRQ